MTFLIEHGACIYATTIRDNETAADKCEEEEENYISCSQYLLSKLEFLVFKFVVVFFFKDIQNDLGVINNGLVYGLYDYDPNLLEDNELEFKNGDRLIILKRGDENENEWWWAKHEYTEKEGYVPRNYLGVNYHKKIFLIYLYYILALSKSTIGFNTVDKLLMPSFDFL